MDNCGAIFADCVQPVDKSAKFIAAAVDKWRRKASKFTLAVDNSGFSVDNLVD